MIKKLQVLAGSALLATSASTMALDIGGLEVPSGNTLVVASVFQNVITAPGQALSGFGEVASINGMSIGELCAGCELTYNFGGYEATALTANTISFSGGWVNFYLGFGADADFNPFGSPDSATDLAAATNGALFLSLAGHQIDAAGNTFAGTGNNIGSPNAAGNGAGLASVDMTGALNGNTAGAGAIANTFFDTNTIDAIFGGNADMQLGLSYSNVFIPHPGECPSGPACLAGSADMRNVVGVIPEPETYALMLGGLLAVGFVASRRRDH